MKTFPRKTTTLRSSISFQKLPISVKETTTLEKESIHIRKAGRLFATSAWIKKRAGTLSTSAVVITFIAPIAWQSTSFPNLMITILTLGVLLSGVEVL
jgi:hypothetical protein